MIQSGSLMRKWAFFSSPMAKMPRRWTNSPKRMLWIPLFTFPLFAETMLSPVAISDTPGDESAFHDALLKVLTLNSQFAPAYIQLAKLSLREGDAKTAVALSRKAEQLEPWRAGYPC